MKLIRLIPLFIFVFLVGCSSPPTLHYLSNEAVILAYGDSLTFGTGANREESYPAVLEQLIHRRVVNAGVPGLETAPALDDLPKQLQTYQPALVILCLGGNDMLRRRDRATIKKNLATMIELIQSQGIDVLLIAVPEPGLMLSPPGFYTELAKEFQIPLMRQLIPSIESSNQYKSDLIHFNALGYRKFAKGIALRLKKLGAI